MYAAVAVAAVVATASIPPAPARWVTDTAGFLSAPARTALDTRLESYERATGHQVVVWIGTSLAGAALDDWAVRTFAAWKVGRKGFDDGIAMFIFADDRKIDIEVGYGLEDKVPDAIASRIIRDTMAPRLRADDRNGAVTAGVDAILAAIEGKPWIGATPTPTVAPPANQPSVAQWILGAIAILGFLIFAVTHPRMAMLFLWTFMGRGGGFGGGGFGGGGLGGGLGGGGFSGGGGGSGGGGARGGW